MFRTLLVMALSALGVAQAASAPGVGTMSIERKTCKALDGVELVYSAAGRGDVALVFVHGGLANRTFWDHELRGLADRYRIVAPDLAGHGESGANRERWGMPQFGADIRAVADAEHLKKIVIFGNSLGGPVAVEAALLMPERVVGVVGVDTFQALEIGLDADQARRRAEAFRDDWDGSMRAMVKMLFHPDADPALMADAERRMNGTSHAAAYKMFLSLGGYDLAAAVRRLTMPLRAINGDLFRTDLAGVRAVKPDFDAVVMTHVGHYPMLEQPEAFDANVLATVRALVK
jgi:sigma-B regulation protein RsbQ